MDQLNNVIHENWYSKNIDETTVHKMQKIQLDLLLDFDCDSKAWRMDGVCTCMYVVSSSRSNED